MSLDLSYFVWIIWEILYQIVLRIKCANVYSVKNKHPLIDDGII